MLWQTFRSQMLAAMIFTLILAALFAAAAYVVIMAVGRRLRGQPAPRRRRWLRRTVVVLATAGALCIAYGYFVEPYWLEVTHVRIASSKLPPGSRPIRIVQISDLHSEAKERLEGRLPGVIAELSPDLIVFTGDAMNSAPGLERFRQCMTRLAAIAPTYAVQGNWDHFQGMSGGFAGTGVIELTGQMVSLELGGAEVRLLGAASHDWAGLQQTLSNTSPEAINILLYHSPDGVFSASAAGVDLQLSGHTHGGQVALPIYGALVTLSSYGKQFERGLYHIGKTTLYVNRGIGMEGGIVPRVRFLARPEVTLIEMCPVSGAQAAASQPR